MNRLMLPRVLETEAMDSLDEAVDYDAMDHAEVNRAFVADLLCEKATAAAAGVMLDLGTGTAQIPIELCRQDPHARLVAVDAARFMLQVAKRSLAAAGLADRVALHRVDGKRLPYADGSFAAVISNSIVHHIPDPRRVIAETWRVVAPGGLVFFRDLLRPDDDATVRRLVDIYAAGANLHQQQMLEDSLRASLRVDEVRQLVAELGLSPQTVQATSDRHWTWSVRKEKRITKARRDEREEIERINGPRV